MKKAQKGYKRGKIGIAIACFAMYMLNAYFIATIPSLYTAVICNDLNLNRATFSLFSMLRSGSSFLWGLVMSRIIGRIHVKPVVALGAVSAAVSMLLMAASRELWSFYVAGVVGSFGYTALNGATLTLIIRQSFAEGQNTLYGLVCASSGIMGVIFNPILSKIVDETSWQHGFYTVGLIIIGIGLAAILLLQLFFHEKTGAEEQKKVSSQRIPYTEEERFRVVVVCALSVITGLCGGVLFVNIAPVMMGFGFSALFTTGLVASAASLFNCGAKILMGRLFDIVSPKRLFTVWNGVLMIGLLLCAVLKVSHSQALAIVATACIGSSCGIGVIGIPVWVGTCFTSEKQRQVIYLATAMSTIGGAVGSTLFQLGYNEATRSYDASLLMELLLSGAFACLIHVLYGKRGHCFSKT